MKCSRKCEVAKSIRNVINKNLGTGKNYTLRSSMICIYLQYYRDDHVKKKGWLGHVVRGDVNIGIWFRKLEGNRQRVRPRRRWKDNIKMDLKEIV